MTIESNAARDNICELIEAGKSFQDIATAMGIRKILLKEFFAGTGRDLEPRKCEALHRLVKGLT